MVQAQTLMHTDVLIGLMIFAALIGFIIDRVLKFINGGLQINEVKCKRYK